MISTDIGKVMIEGKKDSDKCKPGYEQFQYEKQFDYGPNYDYFTGEVLKSEDTVGASMLLDHMSIGSVVENEDEESESEVSESSADNATIACPV